MATLLPSEGLYLVVKVGAEYREADLEERVKSSSFDAGAIADFPTVRPAQGAVKLTLDADTGAELL